MSYHSLLSFNSHVAAWSYVVVVVEGCQTGPFVYIAIISEGVVPVHFTVSFKNEN